MKSNPTAGALFALSAILASGTAPAQNPETSAALPKGMRLVWADEFNEKRLDRSKWTTNYYSQLNFWGKDHFEAFRKDSLPQPYMEFTDSSVILKVDDRSPESPFWESGRKISSIQTYDWNADRNLMPGNIGGYFEARIRRNAAEGTKGLNTAFWFDSPGPDSRYYLEQGSETADSMQGWRPRGQVFEIDLCEYINTEIVLHGNVALDGKFEGNIGHFVIPGDYRNRWVRHGMLWTPAGLKFYIDGRLVAESWDPDAIKSPNHAMVMFFGAYGHDGMTSIEVDYVRHYQWGLDETNELPNGGFEYDGASFPWEGGGRISPEAARNGRYGLVLAPGESVSQYVYADPSRPYEVSFYAKGRAGRLHAEAANIRPVSGEVVPAGSASDDFRLGRRFLPCRFSIVTPADHPGHKTTVRITFTNNGKEAVSLDDIVLSKR